MSQSRRFWLSVVWIAFKIFMFSEILFAERTQNTGFQPIFNAFSVESMLAKEIAQQILTIFFIFFQTN